ncbi:MAG: hypothetical protein ABIA12_01465 [Candidatus Aenigmatarchaeota archaeon]
MNLKAVFAVVVVIGIGFMLMQTEPGREYFGWSFEFLKARIGGFVSGAFTYGGIFGQKMPEGATFRMSLTAARQGFFSQNYTVSNASLSVSGVCASAVRISTTSLHKESLECKIESPAVYGLFEYTTEGNVRFTGEAEEITVDGTKYTLADGTSEKPMKVSFEVAPLGFVLDRIAQPLISLQSVEGSIRRLAADGTAKSTEELNRERLDIGGFMGFLKLDNSNIILQGSAVFVKGAGDHSSFVW